MDKSRTKNEATEYCRKILPGVSRTFNLAIKFLPQNLGRPVSLAYLLCRIADTYEDSAVLDASQRREMLFKYAALLDNPHRYDPDLVRELKTAFADPILSAGQNGPANSVDHGPSLNLVENLDQVLNAVDTLPPNFKEHIFPRVREMAIGMADYTLLASGRQSEIVYLQDEQDWNRYCYYVAGTVGHMLTDIFSDYAGFPEYVRQRLHPLGRSFGLGLQKVNVLKDAVIDTKRGICFLPKTFIEHFDINFSRRTESGFEGDIVGLVTKVVQSCHRHFEDSLEYIQIIPRKHTGLRMFLIVPVMLAAGTMRMCTEYPQRLLKQGDLKLNRDDVWRLVRKSSLCKFSNLMLYRTFRRIYPAVV
jgi:farnesyl-diphosphate farnesyltransferase